MGVRFRVPFAAHAGRSCPAWRKHAVVLVAGGHEPPTLVDRRTARTCAPAAGQGIIGRVKGPRRVTRTVRRRQRRVLSRTAPEQRPAGRQRPRKRNSRGHQICSDVPVGRRLRDRRVPRWTDRCDRHYGPMYGAIGRVCLISPRSAVEAQAVRPAVTGFDSLSGPACYDFLYEIKASARRPLNPEFSSAASRPRSSPVRSHQLERSSPKWQEGG